MTKTGKDPVGYFARIEGALPTTLEEERDKAAKHVLSRVAEDESLTRAEQVEQASELLDALGIDPRVIGTRISTTVKLPKSTPRRRFR